MQSLLHAEFARASSAARLNNRPAPADEPSADRPASQRALRCIVRAGIQPRLPRITRTALEPEL